MRYWLWIITSISVASALIPFTIGLVRVVGPKGFSLQLKLVVLLTGVSFVSDIVSMTLFYFKISPNYSYNVYRLIEFFLQLMIYAGLFKNRKLSGVFLFLSISAIAIYLFNLLYLQHEKTHSYMDPFSAFVFTVISAYFFYRLMHNLPAQKMQRLPMFWINTAILVYFSGNLFVFIPADYLVTFEKNDLVVVWGFHNLLLLIKNILFAIGLWLPIETVTVPASEMDTH